MALSLRLDQTVTASASWVDQHGNPIGSTGVPTATVQPSDTATATLQPDGQTFLIQPLRQYNPVTLTINEPSAVNPAQTTFAILPPPPPPPVPTTGTITFGTPTPP